MEFYTWAFVGLVVASGIRLYLWWLRKNDDYWEKRGIPHEKRGNIIAFLRAVTSKNIHELLIEQYHKHGRIYGGFELRKPNLTVCEPDLLRDILVKDFQIFNYRRDLLSGDKVIDSMVSILKGEDWKRVRATLSPAFTSKRMRQMSHIINECSQTVVDTLGKHAEQNKPADVKSIFGAFTMDVIARAAFATKIDSHNDPGNIFVRQVKESFLKPNLWRIFVFFVLPQWVVANFRLSTLFSIDFFKNVVLQVIKERKEKGTKYNDFLQLLMESQEEVESDIKKQEMKNVETEDEADRFGSIISGEVTSQVKYKKLSSEEVLAQCVLFFIVGYETTASTMAYAAYSLALNPECQEKLIQEVDEVFEKNKEIDYDVVHGMKYLDYVTSETLRMYPVLVRSERTACEDYKLGNTGIVIEKGTSVGFNIQAMHYDPEFFPNPEKFDPERFTSENANHPQYAYLPFGAGPRNCLGMRFALMELKICISNILRHYRFKRADTTKVPLEYRAGQGFLIVEDMPLTIEKRSERIN